MFTPAESRHPGIRLLSLVTFAFFLNISSSSALSLDNVSLKKYKVLSLPVPNPMDLTRLPPGKTFQVTDPDFILQFFFIGTDIYGLIFKHDTRYSLFVRWCFYRSCEESKYDYKVRIASAHFSPAEQRFFEAKLPLNFKYKFQGLEFSAFK